MLNVDRRQFLTSAGAGGMAAIGAGGLVQAREAEPPKGRKRVLRLAHLTDVHVQPELNAPKGMAACLEHVQGQGDKPELILFGGDCVMDSFGQTRARTQTQWDLWHKLLQDHCSLPWEGCIGNHDVWGWSKSRSGATGEEKEFGKQWATEALRMSHRYRSFVRAGWKFIVLDSTHPGPQPETYTAKLDNEQFDWLAAEVAGTPKTTPILILSHIPIFSASPFLDGLNEKSGNWNVPGAWMHIDARKLIGLFHEHGNVKICLSGHIHLADRVDYLGTTYYCNGAVCGGWWKGKYQQFGEGYALVDLYDDGTTACEYITYGWKAQA